MTQKEVLDLMQHYNKPEQASDPIAVQTRIALSEYAALITEHRSTRQMLEAGVMLLSERQ